MSVRGRATATAAALGHQLELHFPADAAHTRLGVPGLAGEAGGGGGRPPAVMVTTRARAARGPTRPEGPPPPGASRGPGEPSTSASGAAGGEGRGAWPAGYTVHRLVEELERPASTRRSGARARGLTRRF